MKKALQGLAVLVCMTLIGGQAQANLTTFETDETTSAVTLSNVDNLSLGSPSATLSDDFDHFFQLAPGDSHTFDFFSLYLPIGFGSADVTATLGFQQPDNVTGTGSGSGSWWSLGFISGGSLTWSTQPGSITAGDGSVFDVMLPNLEGIQLGKHTNVTATVTSRSAAAVPEPTALALLGLGLVGVGAASRRRRRSPQA